MPGSQILNKGDNKAALVTTVKGFKIEAPQGKKSWLWCQVKNTKIGLKKLRNVWDNKKKYSKKFKLSIDCQFESAFSCLYIGKFFRDYAKQSCLA